MNLYISNFRYKKRRVIYLLILLLISFFIFDRIAFYSIREISYDFYKSLRPNTVYSNISKKQKEYYNTLILGSSRTKQGIHPWYLKEYLGLKSFKNAGAGRYLKYNYLFYNIYKKKYKTPKYLLYGFDYFIFGRKSSIRRLNVLHGKGKRRTKKMNTNLKKTKINPISYISLLYRKKKEIDTFIIDIIDSISNSNKKNIEKELISDFKGQKKTISLDDQREPANWKKAKYPKYPGPEGKYFDMLLNTLKKDKVKVFIVILPDYINVYKTNYEQNLFKNQLKELCKKFTNVTILNYNSIDKFDLSNPKLFRDGKYGSRNSHLSYYGAKILNEKLCEDISKLIVK